MASLAREFSDESSLSSPEHLDDEEGELETYKTKKAPLQEGPNLSLLGVCLSLNSSAVYGSMGTI